ncbi:hypothetical protein [Phaffia rhodozyma]|uniref:Uncharacterized protein n=1 Tax=Phaffia rhodozyma TaxID=264483 RepID=A0A0F7SEL8_PHARH|nr:hypothetical protein [Phaffia rhodozyma]
MSSPPRPSAPKAPVSNLANPPRAPPGRRTPNPILFLGIGLLSWFAFTTVVNKRVEENALAGGSRPQAFNPLVYSENMERDPTFVPGAKRHHE